MWYKLGRARNSAIAAGLAIAAMLFVGVAIGADEPSSGPGLGATSPYIVTDALPGTLYSATSTGAYDPGVPQGGGYGITGAHLATAGPLTFADMKLVEGEARARLKRASDVRAALSPYQGNVGFQQFVRKLDAQAGWALPLTITHPYTGTATSVIEVVQAADEDLRAARDLYAFLAVFAPEPRFRGDSNYITTTYPVTGTLCGVVSKEDPNPPV